MPDAPRPPAAAGGSNVSRAWAQRAGAGGRRVFPPRPPPPPFRRAPPHGAADNGRRGGSSAGAGEEADGRYARRGVADCEREVAVGASTADPAGAGRNAAAAGGEAPEPPAREEDRGGRGGGVGSKRPSSPPPQHLPPPKRRAVSATRQFLPPASGRTAAAPAPAPLAGADADAGSRTRYDGERENRDSDALVEKPAVARPLAARRDGVGGVLSRAVPPNAAGTRVLNKTYATDGAAPMANSGRHGPKAGIVNSSAAQGRGRGAGIDQLWGKKDPVVLNKPYATDGAAPMVNSGRHSPKAGMVKSSAAQERGRGAGIDEPWGKKDLVTATRLPPKPETKCATRTSQPGHAKDGGFSSKVHRPVKSGRAHGGLAVPEKMLAIDDDSSLADGRAVQIGVAAHAGTSVGAVRKDGKLEKGKAPSKESRGYQASSSAALLDSAIYRDGSARHSSGVSGNFGRQTPSREQAKDVKVTNKYGESSYRYSTAVASLDKDSSKKELMRKIVFESGRINRGTSSDVAAGVAGESNVLRSKDMFTNQNTVKPTKVVQKSELDTQHRPFSRDKKEIGRERQVTSNGIQDSIELTKDRVMQGPMSPDMHPMAHKKSTTNMVKPKTVDYQQRNIASTSVSGSKGKLDDSNLTFHDIFRDVSFCEGKLELHLNSSSGLPIVRCQRQYGYKNADARSRFKMLCRMFEFVCRTLAQIVEQRSLKMRIDFEAAQVMKTKLRRFIKHGPIVGQVPGVEVGDEFLYRSQLAIAGLHHDYRKGISTTYDGMLIAISIVASGGYPDELDCSGELIYSGSGGKPAGKKKEDQKLKGGNLALKNCIKTKTHVRVIHGFKCQNTERGSHLGAKLVSRYTYDGLYSVVDFWMEGQPGSRMFKYKLQKIPGQPELPMHKIKRLKSYKSRPGLCMNDISEGKEATPISVINIVDDVRPAPFQYTTRIIYPFQREKHQGCDCTNGCSDFVSCACAVNNGGEIPFDINGAILNEKSVIFECGPSCKCPPSCHNRVSQHHMKIPLEVFRTSKTGWGVRSLRSIPSGSFICEYIGELLHPKEADKRRNTSYLFDVGLNYDENVSCGLLSNVSGLNSSSSCSQTKEDLHFTIDASENGNIGRFINHSCSPNLQAQNVLWDHDDKRMPHIMFFAAGTIPPLQELTYDYNNSEIDRVRGVNRRIKPKACRCGSSQCRGTFY